MKIKHSISILAVICILVGCNSSDNEAIPESVIPQETMATILADVHIAEALAESQKPITSTQLNQWKKSYFVSILEQYDISEEAFDESYLYYENNVELLNEMYDLVLEELSKREAEIMHQ